MHVYIYIYIYIHIHHTHTGWTSSRSAQPMAVRDLQGYRFRLSAIFGFRFSVFAFQEYGFRLSADHCGILRGISGFEKICVFASSNRGPLNNIFQTVSLESP